MVTRPVRVPRDPSLPKRPRGRPPGRICDTRTDIRMPEPMLERVRQHAFDHNESIGAWFRRAVLYQLDLEDVRAKVKQ